MRRRRARPGDPLPVRDAGSTPMPPATRCSARVRAQWWSFPASRLPAQGVLVAYGSGREVARTLQTFTLLGVAGDEPVCLLAIDQDRARAEARLQTGWPVPHRPRRACRSRARGLQGRAGRAHPRPGPSPGAPSRRDGRAWTPPCPGSLLHLGDAGGPQGDPRARVCWGMSHAWPTTSLEHGAGPRRGSGGPGPPARGDPQVSSLRERQDASRVSEELDHFFTSPPSELTPF